MGQGYVRLPAGSLATESRGRTQPQWKGKSSSTPSSRIPRGVAVSHTLEKSLRRCEHKRVAGHSEVGGKHGLHWPLRGQAPGSAITLKQASQTRPAVIAASRCCRHKKPGAPLSFLRGEPNRLRLLPHLGLHLRADSRRRSLTPPLRPQPCRPPHDSRARTHAHTRKCGSSERAPASERGPPGAREGAQRPSE